MSPPKPSPEELVNWCVHARLHASATVSDRMYWLLDAYESLRAENGKLRGTIEAGERYYKILQEQERQRWGEFTRNDRRLADD